MNRQEAFALIGVLAAAFPQRKVEADTVRVYARSLEDLPYDIAREALSDVVRSSVHFPSIAEIRRAVAERSTNLPSPAAAWEWVTHWAHGDKDWGVPPEPVTRAVKALGGTWAIKTTENPSVLRSQFNGLYAEFREEELRKVTVPQTALVRDDNEALQGARYERMAIEGSR